MIDLHSHILPGLDDGPSNSDFSVAMARSAVEDGTQMIVATPHIRGDYAVDIDEIAGRVEELNRRHAEKRQHRGSNPRSQQLQREGDLVKNDRGNGNHHEQKCPRKQNRAKQSPPGKNDHDPSQNEKQRRAIEEEFRAHPANDEHSQADHQGN